MQAKKITIYYHPYNGGMNTGRPSLNPRVPFGERLHNAREALGLSQAQVAKQLGMSQNAYACWERKPVALRPEQIEQLANILRVPVTNLFTDKDRTGNKSGPTGKARRIFDEVSRLPRKRQQRILSVVDDMLAAQRMATVR